MSPSEFDFNPLSPGNSDRWVQITGAELYEKVWSTPMVTIAKEFGISDRGLAKVCARLEVPVPPRGYWAKLQAGKPVSKVPLPAPRPMTAQETAIQRTPGSQLLQDPLASRDPELQARIDVALASAQPVRVPRSLSNSSSSHLANGWTKTGAPENASARVSMRRRTCRSLGPKPIGAV